jgi:hypothetical protein
MTDTKTETKHTPLPWAITCNEMKSCVGLEIHSGKNTIVYQDVWHEFAEQAKADFAMIVRAVNSHDELCEAVKFALKYAAMREEKGDAMPSQLTNALRAALAKADMTQKQ